LLSSVLPEPLSASPLFFNQTYLGRGISPAVAALLALIVRGSWHEVS